MRTSSEMRAVGHERLPTRRAICSASTMNAGPETNAEAMNRGARMAVFQNGRPPSPLYRNAVTVWMDTAHTMLRNTNGLYQRGSGWRPR
jgi:hypothetical protein